MRPGSAGVAARNAALGRGDTLILAFSHEGRRDPLFAFGAWLRMAKLFAIIWIPAFAGMTGWACARPGSAGVPARNAAFARGGTLILAFSHEGRRDPLFAFGAWLLMAKLFAIIWIPAFAGMTGVGKREWRRRQFGMAARQAAQPACPYSPTIMRTLHKAAFAPGIHWPVSTWLIG